MAKTPTGFIKLQIPGGKCTPAPPVGPALGQHGVNIGEFVKRFNDATSDRVGRILPVEITVYSDKSFDFILKQPPASVLIKEVAGIASGAKNSKTDKAGRLTDQQLTEIAKTKMPDLNTKNIDKAKKIIAGTARNMGVAIEG